MESTGKEVIAVVGGTGKLGLGLARRWALAGREVIIGSRVGDKALSTAQELRQSCASQGKTAWVSGCDNVAAAQVADIVVMTVPFAHQVATLESIKPALTDKILVDTTVPLVPPRVARVQLPAEGCAARISQRILGDGVRVVSAFHNVAAENLGLAEAPKCDVLVYGDNKEAREKVIELAQVAGMRALHGGSLDNSAASEALTSVLIFINKQHSCHAGILITGISEQR